MARKKRLIRQAALQSLVRFGPQIDALDQLTRTAKDTYSATIGAADASSAATAAAISSARKPTAAIYDNAHQGQEALNSALATGIGGLSGPGTDLLKAAALSEAHMASTHLRESKVNALQELTNRGIQAEAGRQQAVIAAGARLHDDISQIGQSRMSLTGQAGAFQATTLGDLLGEADEQAFTAKQKRLDRQSREQINAEDNATSTANTQARIQAAKDKENAKGKGVLPNGVKRATPLQHGAARDKVDLGIAQAKRMKAAGRSRSEIAKILLDGRSPTKLDDGTPVPGIAKQPPLLASVALDMLFDGHVSARNRKLLNQRGLTVKGLGYKGPDGQKPRKPRRRRRGGVGTQAGTQIAAALRG